MKDIHNKPEYASWFRDDLLTEGIRRQIFDTQEGAGTTRPFGRISFFEKAEEIERELRSLTIPPAINSCSGLHGESIQVDRDAFHIYIVSSLSGGTGAGVFFDMAAMLRRIEREQSAGGGAPWHIFGVFILPEVICADPRIERPGRIRSNAYAALKEIDYFMSGNSFTVQYPHWTVPLELSNREYRESLFNLIFLVDRTDESELATRDDAAEVSAEFLFYHAFTRGNSNYFQRYIDDRATLKFAKAYPCDTHTHQYLTVYSAMGVNTIYIPVNELIRFCILRQARDIFNALFESTDDEVKEGVKALWLGNPGTGQDSLLKMLGLSDDELNEVFGLARDPKLEKGHIIGGNLKAFSTKRMSFFDAVKQEIELQSRRSWRRLWMRRIELQAASANINSNVQAISRDLEQLENDPEFFPAVGGVGPQQAGSVESRKYKDAIESFRQSILGSPGNRGRLEDVFEKIINDYTPEVAGQALLRLRNHLTGAYGTVPALEKSTQPEFRLDPTMTDPLDIQEAIDRCKKGCSTLVEKYLVRAAMIKREHVIGQIITRIEALQPQITKLLKEMNRVESRLSAEISDIRFPSSPWRKSAIDFHRAERIYSDLFCRNLSGALSPESLAGKIRTEGLEVLSRGKKDTVFPDDFGQYSPEEIFSALIGFVERQTGMPLQHDSVIEPGSLAADHRKIWLTSFEKVKVTDDSEGVFSFSPQGGDDIEKLAKLLIDGARWHLPFRYSGGDPYAFCYEGSLAGHQEWKTALGPAVQRVETMPTYNYNQVSLLQCIHALPICSLTALAKWREGL